MDLTEAHLVKIVNTIWESWENVYTLMLLYLKQI